MGEGEGISDFRFQIEGDSLPLRPSLRRTVEAVSSHGSEIDLILLDLNMPEMDGVKALDCIRAPDARFHCARIYLTFYPKEVAPLFQ